jgi:hypothetical protein
MLEVWDDKWQGGSNNGDKMSRTTAGAGVVQGTA